MKQNETFKAMLAEYNPDLGDSNEYIGKLQSKLDAVEAVRRMCEEECRRMRRRMIVAFISGGIAGAAAIIYILLHPVISTASNHHSVFFLAHADHVFPLLVVPAFAVLSAVVCTLLYQILKKDFSEAPLNLWGGEKR